MLWLVLCFVTASFAVFKEEDLEDWVGRWGGLNTSTALAKHDKKELLCLALFVED